MWVVGFSLGPEVYWGSRRATSGGKSMCSCSTPADAPKEGGPACGKPGGPAVGGPGTGRMGAPPANAEGGPGGPRGGALGVANDGGGPAPGGLTSPGCANPPGGAVCWGVWNPGAGRMPACCTQRLGKRHLSAAFGARIKFIRDPCSSLCSACWPCNIGK